MPRYTTNTSQPHLLGVWSFYIHPNPPIIFPLFWKLFFSLSSGLLAVCSLFLGQGVAGGGGRGMTTSSQVGGWADPVIYPLGVCTVCSNNSWSSNLLGSESICIACPIAVCSFGAESAGHSLGMAFPSPISPCGGW